MDLVTFTEEILNGKLYFCAVLGNNSLSGIDGTPISYVRVDSSTITVSYLDSQNCQFCCPWKRGALILVVFYKK